MYNNITEILEELNTRRDGYLLSETSEAFQQLQELFAGYESTPLKRIEQGIRAVCGLPVKLIEKHPDKRKVEFDDYTASDKPHEAVTRKGWFHKWARGFHIEKDLAEKTKMYINQTLVENPKNEQYVTTMQMEWDFAIIEDETGKVYEVLPRFIRFID